ncbi:MAG: alpha/beta hydrolase [Clostridia bacterium]|nr:alpha/beta hydrolase [Clostridia bacterium]
MEMQAAGVNIHYELSGTGSRRVVLLHGWGCSTKLMKPVADHLSKDMTVLSVDFPAHGKSGRPAEPWGVPEFAACLLELLKRLEFLPCSVIAHSFGGRVTIELASADASLFERIILTGAAGIKPPSSGQASKRTQTYKRLKAVCEGMKKARIFGSLPERWNEALIQKYGSKDYAALDPEMRKTFVKVVNYDQTDKLASIRNSTLLVWGDKDTETPLWMGQKMEKAIPDSGLVVLSGGTHFAYLEQAVRFNAIAHNFLMESI